MGYNPWGCKGLNMTERARTCTHTHTHTLTHTHTRKDTHTKATGLLCFPFPLSLTFSQIFGEDSGKNTVDRMYVISASNQVGTGGEDVLGLLDLTMGVSTVPCLFFGSVYLHEFIAQSPALLPSILLTSFRFLRVNRNCIASVTEN